MADVVNHRILATFEQPGALLTDHLFRVPLDHRRSDNEQLEIFAREVVDPQRFPAESRADAPWLLYLQGGPGMAANRPLEINGWLAEALKSFRVLLLDQRGTGRSAPVTRQTLPLQGTVRDQADYLRHFRADSIVADAEFIRAALGVDAWSILGQSFGGFCALSYLSFAPSGLREVLITGGLGPVHSSADDVYRATYDKLRARNEQYYRWYPQDQAMARRIADHLLTVPEHLPTGERLTVHRFQMLGHFLGGNARVHGLHYLLEDPFVRTVHGPRLSDSFLQQTGAAVSFAAHPLYALLHESIYAQGEGTHWAADRVLGEYPQFAPTADPLLFTGEMIHPWYFVEDPALIPLAELAEELARTDDWDRLYDPEQLAVNRVPAAAAVYRDDIFVPREISLRTAEAVNGLRVWETADYHHDGLRQDGAAIFARLLGMCRG